MEKHVHDPSRNVDRAPRQEKRVGNGKVDREAKRDREMQQNVDQTIEDSFPASDPPSWNTGSSSVQDDEVGHRQDEEDERQQRAGEHTQDRSAAARVAERNRRRSKNAPGSERSQEPSSEREALERHQQGGSVGGHAPSEARGEVRIDDRGMSSQREQPGLAERTPEQRDTNAIGPGPRLEDLDRQVLAEQDKPHLQPEHTDERTDLPGRRAAPQGPHQAFPGESPASRQPRR